MTATLTVDSGTEKSILLDTLAEAVSHETAHMEASISRGKSSCVRFEEQYGILSETIETLSAEESGISDDDFTDWLGEYRLLIRLQKKYQALKELQVF